MKICLLHVFLFFFCLSLTAEYKSPPDEIIAIVNAPSAPAVVTRSTSDLIIMAFQSPLLTIAEFSEPFYPLAGVRITSDFGTRKSRFYQKFIIKKKDSFETVEISGIPENLKIYDYSISPDGKFLLFTARGKKAADLWSCNLSDRKARIISTGINTTLGSFEFIPGKDAVIAQLAVNIGKTIPASDSSILSPVIEETGEQLSRTRTYQDLLKNSFDEELLKFFCTSVTVRIELADGRKHYLDKPGIRSFSSVSPDGKYLLYTEYLEPFSRNVPIGLFPREYHVRNLETGEDYLLASQPVSDSYPLNGIYTGPRNFQWASGHDHSLVFIEALDGGDPEAEAPFRDRLKLMTVPDKKIENLLDTRYRFYDLFWIKDRSDLAFIREYDWKRRWSLSHLVSLKDKKYLETAEDRSYKDEYSELGEPVTEYSPTGLLEICGKDGKYFFSSSGATPDGYLPVLRTVSFNPLQTSEVFRCEKNRYDSFLKFCGDMDNILLYCQSADDYPNYFLMNLRSEKKRQLTFLENPAPGITESDKMMLKYERSDGIPLSGILYLPPGFDKKRKIPAYIYAYPLEYNDASTAGQVRGTENTFTRLSSISPLFFLFQGVAVFMNAQFPVVGDPKTMNDTYIEQLRKNSAAAVKALENTGFIDTERLACIGHSYGAFMVTNLLIHTDHYKTGIAQSGAYNRTLTPFGFQSERRTYWEASETYNAVSPFMHADKLKRPILFIHGEADNNPGTFTLQSERMYAAVKGNGGISRLVKLPCESHSYYALESILHVLWERYQWTEKHLKN